MNKQDEEKAKSYELSNDLEETFHGELEEAFLSGCEYKEQQMIEKAIEYLEPIFKNLAGYNCGGDLTEDFKKYMEEN